MGGIRRDFLGLEKKILLKYAGPYFIIFLIPVVLFFATIYIVSTQNYKNEEVNMKKLLQNNVHSIQVKMDELIERCQTVNYVLLQDESMHYLLHFSENSNSKVDLYNISKELRDLCLLNDNISEIIISLNQSKIVINQQGILAMEEAYVKYIEDEASGYSYQDWIGQTLDFTGGKIQFYQGNHMYFVRSYPISPMGMVSDSLTLIKIKDSMVQDTLQGVQITEGATVAIIDDKTRKHIWSSNQIDYLEDDGLFNNASGYFAYEDYLIAYKKSEQLSITYVSAVPKSVLENQRTSMNGIILMFFLLCVVIGCGLIVLYTLKKSNPVRQLLSLVNTHGSGKGNFLDPYLEIKSMLLDAADMKLANMHQNDHHEFIEKKKTLIAILYDKKSTMDLLLQTTQQLSISCENNLSVFVKLKCVDISAYFEKVNDYGKIDCTPIQFCDTILSQILSKHYTITNIPYGHEAFVIITLEDKNIELFYKSIREHLQQAQRLLQESSGIDTVIALSNFHSGIKGLLAGFKEVNSIMEYMELMGDRNLYEYNMVPLSKNQNEFHTSVIKTETMMISCIKSEDFDKAKVLFNQIISTYFSDMHNSPQVLKLRLYTLVGKILETLNFLDLSDANNLIEGLTEQSQLMMFNNIIEFQEKMNHVFDKLGEFVKESEGKEEDSFIKNIRDIISHNYMDPDLNVSMIANLLDKNLDYVSRNYKKLSGNGLLDSIQDFRIRKAKTYMDENSELSIQQVSSMVGYVNCESFIRVFKHREGVTPGRYKSMVNKK